MATTGAGQLAQMATGVLVAAPPSEPANAMEPTFDTSRAWPALSTSVSVPGVRVGPPIMLMSREPSPDEVQTERKPMLAMVAASKM
jgi:hypothetical protein